MAGNRTRVNCLEGSYAHHYTTNARTSSIDGWLQKVLPLYQRKHSPSHRLVSEVANLTEMNLLLICIKVWFLDPLFSVNPDHLLRFHGGSSRNAGSDGASFTCPLVLSLGVKLVLWSIGFICPCWKEQDSTALAGNQTALPLYHLCEEKGSWWLIAESPATLSKEAQSVTPFVRWNCKSDGNELGCHMHKSLIPWPTFLSQPTSLALVPWCNGQHFGLWIQRSEFKSRWNHLNFNSDFYCQ